VLWYTVFSLLNVFDTLLHAFGPRDWWPGDSPLEIAVGAILTQNTAWKNVEKAIGNMKAKRLLDAQRLKTIDMPDLAEIVRPAGFYRIKAARLKSFVAFLWEKYQGSIENMRTVETEVLRDQLLTVRGIGPETADSILLYALDKPIFVVDAYTFRFLRNHGIYTQATTYCEVQSLFMRDLPLDTHLFNEFHALIVFLCQKFCKKKPLCGPCPLANEEGEANKSSWARQ
jgi:endonuclease III related protein